MMMMLKTQKHLKNTKIYINITYNKESSKALILLSIGTLLNEEFFMQIL